MSRLPTLAQLLPAYEAAVQALRTRGDLTVEQGVDLVVAFYRQVRIGAAGFEQDCLLLQYGVQNWPDERGELLSCKFEFDPLPFLACSPYSSWSTVRPALAQWADFRDLTLGVSLG